MPADSEALDFRKLGFSEIAAATAGFVYISGYYVNSIFVRNYGIPDIELFRLEYIKIGFVFLLVTLGFIFLPVGAFRLTYSVRKNSTLPHYHTGAIGNSLNTTLLLSFPLFLVIFLTRYEWSLAISLWFLGTRPFSTAVAICVEFLLFGVIILPGMERLINRFFPTYRMMIFRFVVEPLRYGIFAISFTLVMQTMSQVPWIWSLIKSASNFLLTDIVLVVGNAAAILWIRLIRKISGASLVYALIAVGLASIYFMAVNSYVIGVYGYIPANRGGRLPVIRAYVESDKHKELFKEERDIGGKKTWGPLYIIEENGDSMFVASEHMENWLTGFVPIHVLRKTDIPYVYLERIEDGFPRIVKMPTLKKSKPG